MGFTTGQVVAFIRSQLPDNLVRLISPLRLRSVLERFASEYFNKTSDTLPLESVDGLPAAMLLKANLVGGKIPASELPSYVDDVVESATLADLPVVGEAGKLYNVTANAADPSKNGLHRWTGSSYAMLPAGSALAQTIVDGLTAAAAPATANPIITKSALDTGLSQTLSSANANINTVDLNRRSARATLVYFSGAASLEFTTFQQAYNACGPNDLIIARGNHAEAFLQKSCNVLCDGATFAGVVFNYLNGPTKVRWRGGHSTARVFAGRSVGSATGHDVEVYDLTAGPDAALQLHTNNTDSGAVIDRFSFFNCAFTHVNSNQRNDLSQFQSTYFERCTFQPTTAGAVFRLSFHSQSVLTALNCRFLTLGGADVFEAAQVRPRLTITGESLTGLGAGVINLAGNGLRVGPFGDPFTPGAAVLNYYPEGATGVTLVAKYTRAANDYTSGQDLKGSGAPNYASAKIVLAQSFGPAAWFDAATSEFVIQMSGNYALECAANPFDGDQGGTVAYNAPHHTPLNASYAPQIFVYRAGAILLSTASFGSGAYNRNSGEFHGERAALLVGDRVGLYWYSDVLLRVTSAYLGVTKIA